MALRPGAETGRHRHGHDYVVVPLTDGTLLLETPRATAMRRWSPDRPTSASAGVEHNVINASAHEVVFVETEIMNPHLPPGSG